jgi:hypothetical protein
VWECFGAGDTMIPRLLCWMEVVGLMERKEAWELRRKWAVIQAAWSQL